MRAILFIFRRHSTPCKIKHCWHCGGRRTVYERSKIVRFFILFLLLDA